MNPVNKKSFAVLLINLLVLFILIFASWFLYINIKNTSKVIFDASSQIALLQEKEREFDESSANLKTFSRQIQDLNNAFLTASTFVDFIKLMEGLSKTS